MSAEGQEARIPDSLDAAAVQVAIVVPVYKHPGLLIETLESALKQSTSFAYAIVIVNDGCPYAETDDICVSYTIARPDKILYLKKVNGGLSSARNCGIDFCLAAFPKLEGIYLLDADNLIASQLIQRSIETLRASPPHIGWIYPDIDKFGLEEFAETSGGYHVLEHLCWNFCEAGSMIRAAMVRDEGLRYDESMRSGYEDWEFWLQCISKGYRGQYLRDSGFHYRRRAESMLKASEREHDTIVSYIKRKHAGLFSSKSILEQEAVSHRFLVFMADTGSLFSITDPTQGACPMSLEGLVSRLESHIEDPGFGDFPPYLLITSSAMFAFLVEQKLASGLLWDLQRRLGSHKGSRLTVECRPATAMDVALEAPSEGAPVHCYLTATAMLIDELRSSPITRDANEQDAMLRIVVGLPADEPALLDLDGPGGDPTRSLREKIRSSGTPVSRPDRPITDVQYQRMRLSAPPVYSHAICGVSQILPISMRPGAIHVGFLLPVLSFGGVERVALAYAQQLKAGGATIHIFVSSKYPALMHAAIVEVADTITLFHDQALGRYPPSSENRVYFGAPMSDWASYGEAEAAVGLLSAMDAVINFNFEEMNGVMSQLGRRGIKTMTSQHLVDVNPFGQPQGTPHQILAYEHAYAKIIVISGAMRDWMIGMGVPREKILLIPNSGGYVLDATTRDRVLAARGDRGRSRLNILYLGRFDRQKGLDRLAVLIQRTERSRKIEAEWRLVGEEILSDGGFDISALRHLMHPAALTPDELTSHFEWADVVILLSRFEGVPLSIIEGGRLGCVVVATDVGAVAEIIQEGVTGFLIPPGLSDDEIVGRAEGLLESLYLDADLLRRMSDQAAASFASSSWKKNCRLLLAEVGLETV